LWGKAGADKLWSAATIKLIGASVHDADFCERISRIVGQHDVPTWSDSHGRGGQASVSRSFRRDSILSAADIAAIPKSHALLFSAGRRPGMVALAPWYTEPDSDDIRGHEKTAIAEIRDAAIAALGADNALGQHLARERARHTRPGTGDGNG
jgi:type IV secretory pathway TraG/TraD family ATPase VirD4